MKAAIIDVGSNSVRYSLLQDSHSFNFKTIDSTVLADGLFFSGRLRSEAIARTVDAIERFCRRAKSENADGIYIFATEAVRAATNRSEFTQAVLERTGITVDVLDGAAEARIGFLGALPSTTASLAAVFDIGGASCEIVCGADNKITYSKSHPVGCVRLHDGAGGVRSAAEKIIDETLVSPPIRADLLVGIGGTATALGAMCACPDRYDPLLVHGSVVNKDFLCRIADEFFGSGDLMKRYPSLTPNRARVIGYGALTSLKVLEIFGKNEFTVSERDNIEGYYLELTNKGILSK